MGDRRDRQGDTGSLFFPAVLFWVEPAKSRFQCLDDRWIGINPYKPAEKSVTMGIIGRNRLNILPAERSQNDLLYCPRIGWQKSGKDRNQKQDQMQHRN